MSNKHFELNRTTKMLARIFPALLMLTPIVVGAATIDQSTSAPQDFSADSEYVINRDVTVSSADNTPAVSVSGMNVEKVTNEGNISGAGIGLDINIDAQSVEINNNENAIISSATDNAVNVQSMAVRLIIAESLLALTTVFSLAKSHRQLVSPIPIPA